MSNIIIPIIMAALGFVLRVLQEKLLEKKVSLSHKLDNPAVFSLIPPKISFQNLKIYNNGKLPAKNLRVNLNADIFKRLDVIYKPITEENYAEETKEGVLTLKFDRLLPKEELIISFKSSEAIPQDFLINIKSDEMLSKLEVAPRGKSKTSETVNAVFGVITLLSIGFIVGSFILPKPARESLKTEGQSIGFNLITDRPTYSRGQKMEITYQITNLKKELLRDLTIALEIPGFELDYDKKYLKKSFFGTGEQLTRRVIIPIPKDTPIGKHKISLEARAETLDKSFGNETEIFFEVQ